MRFNRLDLNLLVILDKLLAEESVSKVAQQLNMTQSAVSNALRRLREYFEDELFVQVGRRMVPTPFAEMLGAQVRDTLVELERISASRAGFDPAGEERTFTLITSDYAFLVFVAEVVRRLRERAPGIRIRTVLTTENAAEHLRQGLADFLIVPEKRTVEEYPREPLFKDDFVCICWQENPLIGDSISLEQYLNLEHVGTSMGPTRVPHIDDELLAARGFRRNVTIYAPNFTLVADAVMGTDRIATMHRRSANIWARRLPLRLLELPIQLGGFTQMLQWHKHRSSDPGMAWMRTFMRDVAADIGGSNK
jgi:DNA-binding transcriptional LysR family regulator